MAWERKHCMICQGSGKLNIGSNMKLSKKGKQIDCLICDGKGWLNIWKNPCNWNQNFFKRDK